MAFGSWGWNIFIENANQISCLIVFSSIGPENQKNILMLVGFAGAVALLVYSSLYKEITYKQFIEDFLRTGKVWLACDGRFNSLIDFVQINILYSQFHLFNDPFTTSAPQNIWNFLSAYLFVNGHRLTLLMCHRFKDKNDIFSKTNEAEALKLHTFVKHQ